ncbi:MAG: Mrp/NBP35 family ATP-binding protein [Bacteroidales bacterium]|nr:Mrp/NBP35 family ATP-binding protein [Bacteroidales bacterium]
MMISKEDILQALREVHHPARQDRDIVDLGMVHDVQVTEKDVVVTLAFPKRRDPLAEYLIGSTRAALIRHLPASVNSEVKTVVVDEEKPRKKKNLDLGLEQLAEVRHIVGIASGKGGVGKSTVAVNLACALARMGYKVGLADADVYGPSIPVMTGTEGATPAAEPGPEEGKELILPLEKYGVEWMSIGYFADRGQALIWRGPMACNALKQMILQVKWGPLDFLLIDMPPGTGDIHISLVQDIPMEGAVIVTTPQDVALADVEKGVNMFRNENVNRPIFGLVENMAWFTPEEHPDEKYYIFGRDGGAKMARELGVDLLGRIPLVQGIRESGDAGEPVALGSRPDGLAFLEVAGHLAEKLG